MSSEASAPTLPARPFCCCYTPVVDWDDWGDEDEENAGLTGGGEDGIIKKGWDNASFENAETAMRHYNKHQAEYGGMDQNAYLSIARDVLSEPVSDNVPALFRSDGSVSRYRFDTNDFVVGTKEGNIRTAFRPKKGKEYWQEEMERN